MAPKNSATNTKKELNISQGRLATGLDGIVDKSKIAIPYSEYVQLLEIEQEYNNLKENLKDNAEENLDYLIKNPVLLRANYLKGDQDPRKIAYSLFEMAKGISIRNPNKNGERPTQKRGLSIALVDPELTRINFYNQGTESKTINSYVENIGIFSREFKEVVDYSVEGDGMIVVDMYTGKLLMARAIFKGFSEKHLGKNKFGEYINTRTHNTRLASYGGASILVKNSTGEVAAYEAGGIMEIRHFPTPKGEKRNVKLYCNINNVHPTLLDFIS